jgi:hypothetical protein
MKRALVVLLGAAVLAFAGTASAVVHPATLGSTHVLIQHAHFGCHTWEHAGIVTGTAHAIVVGAGHPFTLENRDLADHLLVQTSGPATVAPLLLPHFGSAATITHGAATAITLHMPGTYTFQTQEGDHVQSARDGIGAPADVPDHTLSLQVIVVTTHD